MKTETLLNAMVEVNGKEYKLGELSCSVVPGADLRFDIKQRTDLSDSLEAIIVGLQYTDFADFLMLIEVLDHADQNDNLFLLDSDKFYNGENVNGDVFKLDLFEGNYKDFHKLVGERLER
ncbi:hypothetical protein COF68_05240 [Bacillus toyonensis]|uniref:hypothetical protein n=1 Tax=Bacillus toyonensis TaxID=155322 RepID=UPI000BFC7E8B|nr:hypothetical protein [Bacillus toyonensis]PHE64248.1 hypothetical protein COF68_05240 [Bacillus toyonensis]